MSPEEAQQQSDKAKGCLSCSFMVLGVILPAVGFAYGMKVWQDVETSATLAGAIFAIFWLGALVTALLIQDISWLYSFLPTVGGVVYAIAPDFIPLPLDDITVLAVGIFFSVVLIVKKVAPPYVLLAVLVTGLYAWFGREWITGYVDEAIVFGVVLIFGFILSRRN